MRAAHALRASRRRAWPRTPRPRRRRRGRRRPARRRRTSRAWWAECSGSAIARPGRGLGHVEAGGAHAGVRSTSAAHSPSTRTSIAPAAARIGGAHGGDVVAQEAGEDEVAARARRRADELVRALDEERRGDVGEHEVERARRGRARAPSPRTKWTSTSLSAACSRARGRAPRRRSRSPTATLARPSSAAATARMPLPVPTSRTRPRRARRAQRSPARPGTGACSRGCRCRRPARDRRRARRPSPGLLRRPRPARSGTRRRAKAGSSRGTRATQSTSGTRRRLDAGDGQAASATRIELRDGRRRRGSRRGARRRRRAAVRTSMPERARLPQERGGEVLVGGGHGDAEGATAPGQPRMSFTLSEERAVLLLSLGHGQRLAELLDQLALLAR